MLWLLIASTIIIVYVAYFYLIKVRQYPPGPTPLPLLGNLLFMRDPDWKRKLAAIGERQNGVVTLWLFDQPWVVLASHDSIQEAFIKNGETFSYRPESFQTQFVQKGRFGLGSVDGHFWKEQRSFSLRTLKDFGFGRNLMEEKIMFETHRLMDYLKDRIGDKKSMKCNPHTFIAPCISSIITYVIMNTRYEFENDKEFENMWHQSSEFIRCVIDMKSRFLDKAPWLRHVPLYDHFNAKRFLAIDEQMQQYFMPIIDKKMAELDGAPFTEPDSFLHAYIDEMRMREKTGSMGNYTKWQLYNILWGLWLAGMETTSTALEWCLLWMCVRPDVQAKVQSEIDAHLGPTGTVTMGDKLKLPYTLGTIHEVQRHQDNFGLGNPHRNNVDVTICGHQIPKDTTISAVHSTVHFNAKYFPKPYEFNPQQFVDDPTKYDKFISFGIGKRSCLGEALARMELFLVFVTFMQNFNVSLVGEVPEDMPLTGPAKSFKPPQYEIMLSMRQ